MAGSVILWNLYWNERTQKQINNSNELLLLCNGSYIFLEVIIVNNNIDMDAARKLFEEEFNVNKIDFVNDILPLMQMARDMYMAAKKVGFSEEDAKSVALAFLNNVFAEATEQAFRKGRV